MCWVMRSRPVICLLLNRGCQPLCSIQGTSTASSRFYHEWRGSWSKQGEVSLWLCSFLFLLVMATVSPWLPHLFATFLPLFSGLATMGTAYSGQNVASASPTLQAAGWGLQPGSSTTTLSVGATASAWEWLAPPSLSFPLPIPPAYFHIWCVHLS